ncbi:hypothetical protein Poli38472_011657 [Pythium oligandrum]|uniref:Uncharacterized protein n=1 Tax=Pythium oligandrum TaxID=41045 RepID=A0A8K1CJT8_PYTOL|nr:hypothetical protein Poli38472_011657 [Pythium oligandrum]|eukprot:TMW64777.1 hypothetical protein Poli38472_011657 [Pythium oligandrum]
MSDDDEVSRPLDLDGAATTSSAEVITVSVDLAIILGSTSRLADDEDVSSSWDPSAVFVAAIEGLFDSMMPPLAFTTDHVLQDGELEFPRDSEAPSMAIDRHGSYLVGKKRKPKPSKLLDRMFKPSVYGHSRAPSRVSSRGAASRFGAASVMSGGSLGFADAVLAMKMAKLAIKSNAPSERSRSPVKKTEWNDNSEKTSRSRRPVPDSSRITLSSRYSLLTAGTTARAPVDYEELMRREAISRDISSRDGREKLNGQLERRAKVKLRLRSMIDPSLSVEQEEREALAKARGSLKSQGRSNSIIGSERMLTRVQTVSSMLSMTTRSHETTYRPEDYEGLDSDVVLMDKRGELMVGENCHLVERKPRAELLQDLTHKSKIQPRIKIPASHEPLSPEDVETNMPSPPTERRIQSRNSPARSPSRQTKDPTPPSPSKPVNPLFQGENGSYQSYPKIELDPKKTPLAKGVIIKASEGALTSPAIKEPSESPGKSKSKVKARATRELIQPIAEDTSNDALDGQLLKGLISNSKIRKQSTQSDRNEVAPISARPTARSQIGSRVEDQDRSLGGSLSLPKPSYRQEELSLRRRTPAYGNRVGRMAALQFPDSLGIADDDLHEAIDHSATLQAPSRSLHGSQGNLPKVSYQREFPTPSRGEIHVVSSKAAACLLSADSRSTNPFAFSSALPMVIRGKR